MTQDMYDMQGWTRIPCWEYEDHLKAMGSDALVTSSLTDLAGQFGTPIIFTEWARAEEADDPLLRTYVYPEENRRCEHWFRW